ncbi:MAG: hypothetical protein WAX69_02555, partial [Victivallales bacterium]
MPGEPDSRTTPEITVLGINSISSLFEYWIPKIQLINANAERGAGMMERRKCFHPHRVDVPSRKAIAKIDDVIFPPPP